MTAPTDPLLSILIAVSSRTDLLAECLSSLRRHMPDDVAYETIVVLNEIPPAGARLLESRNPGVRFAPSPVNLGLAGSVNRARREASGRFLATLHDDATIEPGWAEALLAAAERHPRAAVIGSKTLFPDGRLQAAGMILWRSGATGLPWNGPAPAAAEVVRPRAVDYCGTCSLLIRAEVFDEIGGFDEEIHPAYFIDVDLGLAVRSRGFYVLCEPRSVVRHHRQGSSSDPLKQVACSRNRSYLLRKWSTALSRQEPEPEPGDVDAVASALLRATTFARDCDAGLATPVLPDSQVGLPAAAGDSGEVERSYRRNLELQRTVIAQLEKLIEARDAELARYRRMKVVRLAAALRDVRRGIAGSIRRVIGSRS
jgi:GT2 family glycosyltransferase